MQAMLAENERVQRPLSHYYENTLTCTYHPYELLQLSNYRQDQESRMTPRLCG